MMLRPHLLAASFSVLGLCAQTAPTLAVDANANRHPISPYIYGINEWSDNGLFGLMHIPVLRWGGDDATSYNWQNSVKNNTGDNPWCYENYNVSPNFDAFHTANLAAGTVSLGTIPLMDWSPPETRDRPVRPSFLRTAAWTSSVRSHRAGFSGGCNSYRPGRDSSGSAASPTSNRCAATNG
jgi:hypothetical protein